MLAELVFLTRFLGLIYGEREVALNADPQVTRIELHRDGAPFASLTQPPWRAKLDFGSDLGPYELTAIGFDAQGSEIARDTQLINLARPRAEALIVLERSGDALSAKVGGVHIDGLQPRSAVLRVDGRVISKDVFGKTVPLGTLAADTIHVVSAELTYAGEEIVRKEIVFGGKFSEEMPAELTAIAVTERKKTAPAEVQCISVDGNAVAPVAVERRDAHVAFVVNGERPRWADQLPRMMKIGDANLSVIAPVLQKEAGGEYFATYEVPRTSGVRDAIAMRMGPGEKRFAEALAAAGMRALRKEERRVVVYVIGEFAEKDDSGIAPASVRRYLARIGVPLRVWSLDKPRRELIAAWGDSLEDVSSKAGLAKAVARLSDDLASQRIAWIPGAPLQAYRATATPDCAYQPLFAVGRAAGPP